MQKLSRLKGVDRIIDANINRAKEGLRVCEEITRFILNSRNLTAAFKKIRHKIDTLVESFLETRYLMRERQSLKDVGRNVYINELKRKNYQDIFGANIQRVKESIRVLEEFAKLKDINIAIRFKKIRYDLYEVEKKAVRKILSLRCNR